jgi:hypothetical protein
VNSDLDRGKLVRVTEGWKYNLGVLLVSAIVPAAVPPASAQGSPISHMSILTVDEVIVSDMSDIRDLPLDADVRTSDVEYARIMRRAGIVEGGPVTSVSAFNSSI